MDTRRSEEKATRSGGKGKRKRKRKEKKERGARGHLKEKMRQRALGSNDARLH